MNRRNSFRLLAAGAAASPLTAAAGEPPIASCTIPSSGEKIPILGLSSSPNTGERSADELLESLKPFIAMRGKMVSASQRHADSDQAIGRAIKQVPRENLFLTGRIWTTGKEAGELAMKSMMSKLGTEKMDLLMIENLLDAKVHLDTLSGWKADGRVRYIGVHHTISGPGFMNEVAELAKTVALDFVQVSYSLSSPMAEQKLFHVTKDKGIAVIAEHPLGGGEHRMKTQKMELPAWAKGYSCRTWDQLFYKYTMAHPAVSASVVNMGLPWLVTDIAEATRGVMLNEEHRAALRALFA